MLLGFGVQTAFEIEGCVIDLLKKRVFTLTSPEGIVTTMRVVADNSERKLIHG